MLIIYNVFVGLDLSHFILIGKRLIQGRREGMTGGGGQGGQLPPPPPMIFLFFSCQLKGYIRCV